MAQFARYPTSSVSVGSVNQGTPNTTGNRWPVQVTDGTNLATVTVGGAVKVDGSATTQPVSAASLPLPTGAATAAKQPALGTAGTASSDVITVQGIASMTALKVDGSAVTQPVSGTVTANQGGTWNIATVTAVTGITNPLPAGTNTIGNVIPTASAAATWQAEGAVAFSSLTTSFATILTPSASTKIVMMRNNTNGTVAVSFDAGTTTHFTLDSGDQISIDYVGNGLISATTAIQVKYTGSAPTTGTMRVNACH